MIKNRDKNLTNVKGEREKVAAEPRHGGATRYGG